MELANMTTSMTIWMNETVQSERPTTPNVLGTSRDIPHPTSEEFRASQGMTDALLDYINGNHNYTNTSLNNISATKQSAATRVNPFPRVQVYVYIILITVGVLGNSLNLLVLRRMPNTLFFKYIRCLSVVDMGHLLSVTALIYNMWVGYTMSRVYAVMVCRVLMPLMWACADAGTMLTTVIALERVLGSCFPLKVNNSPKSVRALLFTVVVFLVSVVFQIVIALLLYPKAVQLPFATIYFCVWAAEFYTEMGQAFILVKACIFEYIMPLLLLVLNIVLIIAIARIRAIRKNLFEGTSENNPDFGINIVLILLSFKSLLANTPATLIRVIAIPTDIYRPLRVTADILYTFDRASNFLFYLLVNSQFRSHAANFVTCSSEPSDIITRSTSDADRQTKGRHI